MTIKNNLRFILLIIAFFAVIGKSFAEDWFIVDTPTNFKYVSQDYENVKSITFSYDWLDSIDMYQILYWKELWNYTEESNVFGSESNPNTFILWKDVKKWDELYFVLQAQVIWYDSWVSPYSEPVKVVIGEAPVESNNNEAPVENIPLESAQEVPEITKLPTTWPEHVLFWIIALLASAFIFTRKKIKL